MSIDASHFAEITTQLHMLWSGRSYSYLGHSVLLISVFFIDETCNINYASQNLVNILYKSINLKLFYSSIPDYGYTCFTLSTNAISNNTRCGIITFNDSDKFISTENPEKSYGMYV